MHIQFDSFSGKLCLGVETLSFFWGGGGGICAIKLLVANLPAKLYDILPKDQVHKKVTNPWY